MSKKYTDEELKKLAEEKRGDEYDYSELIGNTVIKHGHKHILIKCKKHGAFYQDAYGHIFRGEGCRKCKYEKLMTTLSKDKNDFLNECHKKFINKKLDFSNVEYKNNKTKVKVICHEKFPNGEEHGAFEITPSQLLKNEEPCPYCSNGGRKDFRYFEIMGSYLYKGKYDYSLAKEKYENAKIKVPIICHVKDKNGCEHGIFWQLPVTHLCGESCPKCGRESANKKISYNDDVFRKKVKEMYGDLYDISDSKYIDSKTNVEIICFKHGKFTVTPAMLFSGHGCPKCGHEKAAVSNTMTDEEFKEKVAPIIKENQLSINGKYTKTKNRINVKCLRCGHEWQPTAAALIKGYGCPICNRYGGKTELHLFNIIKNTFNDAIHLYTNNDLLGKQSLDIFIPSLNVGVEYQGEQHFIPLSHLGGVAAYNKTKERDERKNLICKKNGIKLFYVVPKKFYKYNEMYSKNTYFRVDRLIKRLITISNKQRTSNA